MERRPKRSLVVSQALLLYTGLIIGAIEGCAGPLTDPLRIEGGLISGSVVGRQKEVHVYKGIPYAAPPVGTLRWKPPQPVTLWKEVRACTEFGASCPQPKPLIGQDPQSRSEDCLYLNVWSAAKEPGEERPVMVWIHGGGYTTGSGSLSVYEGESLARQGVVLVTINYRLGPFGFFAHPLLSRESSKNVSGNYGLLDQIAALQWVKKNIAAFGGNADCVTVFGESAGAGSVCHLMVSPLAKGLFHRAIAQSGTAYGPHRYLRESKGVLEPMEKIGERMAEELGCHKTQDPLAALRARSAEEILAASHAAQGLFGKGTKFWPIVDGWGIPEEPAGLFNSGKQHDVPLMIGTNADEATLFLKQLNVKGVAGYRFLMRYFFRDHAPEALALYPAVTDAEVKEAMSRVVTDLAFVSPARSVARAMSHVKSRTYLYHFTRVPPNARSLGLGAFHSAEIFYVYNNLSGVMGFDEKDQALSKTMSACWVRFAATGDPNKDGLPTWPAYDADADRHLEFGDEIKVGASLHKEACDLMEKIKRRAMN